MDGQYKYDHVYDGVAVGALFNDSGVLCVCVLLEKTWKTSENPAPQNFSTRVYFINAVFFIGVQ